MASQLKFMQPVMPSMKAGTPSTIVKAESEAGMTRRSMMAGGLGLGVAASTGAAVAAEGTPEFRPTMPTGSEIGADFYPKAAVLAGVLTRVKGLGDEITAKSAAARAPKKTAAKSGGGFFR